MNKKLKNVLLSMGVILALSSANVYAQNLHITVHTPPVASLYPSETSFCHALDTKTIALTGQTFYQNDRLFIPLREFCDKIGCSVSWDQLSHQAKVTREFKSVVFSIDKNKIFVDNIEKNIDAAPVLVDGKTFVPIRALLESLGDEVTWSFSNDTCFIDILEKDKSYLTGNWNTIVDLTKTDTLSSTNGSAGSIKVCVPQILNADATVSIDKINEYFREKGRTEFNSYKKMCTKDISSIPDRKLSYEMSYSIGYNANGILSVQRLIHCDRGGVHPSYEFHCDVFDTNTAKKLYIDDILNGSIAEIQEFLIDKFSKILDENNYSYFKEQMTNSIKENINDVQFYIDGDDLVFIFNPYVVGPYSVGTPRVKINIKENSLMFKRKFIDRTNYEEEIKVLNIAKSYLTTPKIVDKTIINNFECYVLQCDSNLIAIDRNCEYLFKLTMQNDIYKVLDTSRISTINYLSALKLVMNKMNSSDLCYDIGGTLYDDNDEYIIVAMQSLDEDITSRLAVNKKTGEMFSYYFEEQFPEKIDSFKDEYSFLSNSYDAPVMYNGLVYPNNEAAFWAQKCENTTDKENFTSMDPDEARSKGQVVKPREDWENIKLSVMKDIVRAKFSQNSDIAKKLLSTGNANLVAENDWNDTFFGTVSGQGQNYLGKILMDVRKELLDAQKTS